MSDTPQSELPHNFPEQSLPCAATFKILLIGDACVGKTSLLCRYVDGEFRHNYVTTVGIDYKNKVLELDDMRVKLQIWDTAGQERFRTLTNAYYRGAQGVIIMYDITNRSSFDHVMEWVKNTRQHGSVDIQIVLVGHKSDKVDIRTVTEREGELLAENFSALFYEASSLTGHNCDKLFLALAAAIKNVREGATYGNEARISNITVDSRIHASKEKGGCCN